mmetsp:Transcript_3364/g.8538  ORF Transcript_3364/g.8538 Transcript_3364/m.8538 type:complete len:121 (+) Transcript_3364:183-545(+)
MVVHDLPVLAWGWSWGTDRCCVLTRKDIETWRRDKPVPVKERRTKKEGRAGWDDNELCLLDCFVKHGRKAFMAYAWLAIRQHGPPGPHDGAAPPEACTAGDAPWSPPAARTGVWFSPPVV